MFNIYFNDDTVVKSFGPSEEDDLKALKNKYP